MAPTGRVVIAVVLVLVTVIISCVDAVTIKGYVTSARCRSGVILLCNNIQINECCDFVATQGAVQGVQFEAVRASRWMAIYSAAANSGCGFLTMKKQNLHGSPRSFRCLAQPGTAGAKWQLNEPSLFDTTSPSSGSPNTTCEKTHKAILMTWNSTLGEYTEVQ